MKLIIIRHGDPDYSIDSLTEKGWREAEYLSERMAGIDADYYYVSPLGRARDTASITLRKIGKEAVECQWLKEFRVPDMKSNFSEYGRCLWDRMPQDWTKEERFYHPDRWYLPDIVRKCGAKKEYDWVIENFDTLLEKHGYKRDGHLYRAVRSNHDTIVFFCHFRIECVLLSHLMNLSPIVLWHSLMAAPSSVTTIRTEERQEGIACFRVSAFGDTSHLYVQGEAPSSAGRFIECYEKT